MITAGLAEPPGQVCQNTQRPPLGCIDADSTDQRGPALTVFSRRPWLWWLLLLALWALGTCADRLWLHLDQALPNWDHADYLNSAVDHGRALGVLPGGSWRGWGALLDLSPKIPPLASLVNGSVMAISGDAPDQALWANPFWQALLLLGVACWGRQLQGPWFGLLAAALVVMAPGLAGHRTTFSLDLPLTATTTLALWRLGCWQRELPQGGRWHQATGAALLVAAAVLIKQSALLVLAPPCLWLACRGIRDPQRRPQVLAALGLVLALVVPWLKHNWITTLGGTNRAVIESATNEGDPAVFSLAGLLWYPTRLPVQLGGLPLALAGIGAAGFCWQQRREPWPALPPDWGWLLGTTLSALLFITLSPNKDPRYIAPVLPLLALVLAWGWWQLLILLRSRWGSPLAVGVLGAGLFGSAGATAQWQAQQLQRRPGPPVPALIEALRQRVGSRPTTLLTAVSSSQLNEHTFTTYGRLQGGQIVARKISLNPAHNERLGRQAEWIVLAPRDGDLNSKEKKLHRWVASDPRFERLEQWRWGRQHRVELWHRKANAPAVQSFDAEFIRLARGLDQGVAGLAAVLAVIAPQHQIDGHLSYQPRVRAWALQQLQRQPDHRDALWSLALLAVLQNRPQEAEQWFSRLQTLEPGHSWPPAYRAVVLLADWRPDRAKQALAQAGSKATEQPVQRGLLAVSRVLSGDLHDLGHLRSSLDAAITAVKTDLERSKHAPSPPKQP
jgi:4-amino-4-deoxy-L-arabinose transferase-like glycosyltransferase